MKNDHRVYLPQLIREKGWTNGVEVGCGSGMLSSILLAAKPDLNLVGVDLGRRADRVAKLRTLQDQYGSRYFLILDDSVAASKWIKDGSQDFVFIDAAHSYQAVKADIKAWHRKVKQFGWLMGHDYSAHFPGVVKAVNECFKQVEVHPGYIWAVQV